MRLWTLHPAHLDPQGLVAAWREALLAQSVLAGQMRGYRCHPQLLRFRDAADPQAAIGAFLWGIHAEAARRGYRFDAGRVRTPPDPAPAALTATDGQLHYEWRHLLDKLARRSPAYFAQARVAAAPRPHPLFVIVPGGVASWEKANTPISSRPVVPE